MEKEKTKQNKTGIPLKKTPNFVSYIQQVNFIVIMRTLLALLFDGLACYFS